MSVACRPEILLHPNIPKPMHGVAPRVIMGKEWWDVERQKAYKSTNYHCAACGVHKSDANYHEWLEAHELYDMDYECGRMVFKELVPLCHACHNFIHSGRMAMLVSKGEMTESKEREILRHGNAVLKAAKLKQPKPPKKIAAWSNWRLVFNGQEYKPKHKSFAAWLSFYSNGLEYEIEDFMMEEFHL